MYTRKMSTLLLSFGIAVLISLLSTNSIAQEGLILYLPFDEGSGDKVKDHSDTGLDGTVNGKAEWVQGYKGNALSFDGESTYVELPASDVLHEAGEEVTFSLWFKATEVPEGGPPADWDAPACLLGRGNNGDFTLFLAHGSLYAMAWTLGEAWLYLPALEEPLGEIETDRWYNAVCTYDNPVGKLYLDGELVVEKEGAGGAIRYQDDNWTQIGGFRGSKQFFNGVIDDVRIYNRAVTPEEIKKFSPVTLQDKLTTTWGRIKESIQ